LAVQSPQKQVNPITSPIKTVPHQIPKYVTQKRETIQIIPTNLAFNKNLQNPKYLSHRIEPIQITPKSPAIKASPQTSKPFTLRREPVQIKPNSLTVKNVSPTPKQINKKRELIGRQSAPNRLRTTPAKTVNQVFTPAKCEQDADDEIIEVVPIQTVAKQKVFQSQALKKNRDAMEPLTKILEQCNPEPEVHDEQRQEKAAEVVMEQASQMLTQESDKGSSLEKPSPSDKSEPTKGTKAWQCTLCKSIFPDKEDIVTHMRVKHQISKLTGMSKSIMEV